MLWGCYNCMCYIFILPRFFLNVQGLRTLARRRKLCFDTSLNAVTLCTWVNVIHISYFNPRVGVCVIKSYIEYSSLLCCLSLANCIKTKISKLPNMFITNVPENSIWNCEFKSRHTMLKFGWFARFKLDVGSFYVSDNWEWENKKYHFEICYAHVELYSNWVH